MSRGKIVQMEKREIASIKGAKIRAGGRDEFMNKKLYIPPLPPTNIRNSNLIQLNYDVYVSIESDKVCAREMKYISRSYQHRKSHWVELSAADKIFMISHENIFNVSQIVSGDY